MSDWFPENYHDPLDAVDEEEPEPPRHMPEHWYRLYERECVLCGKWYKWRERVYGPRPKDGAKRYVLEQYVCGSHFL